MILQFPRKKLKNYKKLSVAVGDGIRLKLKTCVMKYLPLIDQFDPQTGPQKRNTGSDSKTLLCSTFCPLKH